MRIILTKTAQALHHEHHDHGDLFGKINDIFEDASGIFGEANDALGAEEKMDAPEEDFPQDDFAGAASPEDPQIDDLNGSFGDEVDGNSSLNVDDSALFDENQMEDLTGDLQNLSDDLFGGGDFGGGDFGGGEGSGDVDLTLHFDDAGDLGAEGNDIEADFSVPEESLGGENKDEVKSFDELTFDGDLDGELDMSNLSDTKPKDQHDGLEFDAFDDDIKI